MRYLKFRSIYLEFLWHILSQPRQTLNHWTLPLSIHNNHPHGEQQIVINIPYFSAVALVVWDGFRKVFLCFSFSRLGLSSCHALCLGLWIAVAYVGIDKTTPMSISRHAAQSQAVTITNVVDLAQDGVGLELDLPNCCGHSFTVCGRIYEWTWESVCLIITDRGELGGAHSGYLLLLLCVSW